METLQWTPIGHQVRIYGPGATYANRDKYNGILTVIYTEEMAHAYVSGAHSDSAITREVWEQVMDGCKAQGVRQVTYSHKGKYVTKDLTSGAVHCQPAAGKCKQACEFCRK